MTPLIETGNTIFPSTEIENIAWIMVFIVWFLATLVYPNYLIWTGLTELGTQVNGFMSGLLGSLIFILNLLFTIKAWFWVDILYNLTSTALIQAIFIIGLIIMWIEMQVIIPAYLILNATKTK